MATDDPMPHVPISVHTHHSHSHDHGHDDHDHDPEPPAPIEALHSPYHARTIYRDMEILRQSRQDNPYLKILASSSQTHLNTSGGRQCQEAADAIAADLHARLIRSPPPIMWNRKSEPSFSKLDLDSTCVFQFPPSSGDLKSGKVEGNLGLSPGRRGPPTYRQQ